MEQAKSVDATHDEAAPAVPTASASRRAEPRKGSRKLTDWQRFFLQRLEFLVDNNAPDAGDDPQLKMLRSKAIYSTYLDCQAQGVGDQALQLITPASTKPSNN